MTVTLVVLIVYAYSLQGVPLVSLFLFLFVFQGRAFRREMTRTDSSTSTVVAIRVYYTIVRFLLPRFRHEINDGATDLTWERDDLDNVSHDA